MKFINRFVGPKLSLVLGSLVGACALHFVLSACSGAARGINRSPTADAYAEEPPCSNWQTAFVVNNVDVGGDYRDPRAVPKNVILGAAPLPAGWEPISVDITGGLGNTTVNYVATVRKCQR